MRLQGEIEQYVKILKENSVNHEVMETRQRLHLLLSALVNQDINHRDTLDSKQKKKKEKKKSSICP